MTSCAATTTIREALDAMRLSQAAFYRLGAQRHVEAHGREVHFDYCTDPGCKTANEWWAEGEVAVDALAAALAAVGPGQETT